MEQKEKQLLYYDRYQRMPRHFKGAPIHHFGFKDVKTGDEVTLGACWYNEEVSKALGGHYYEEITEAVKDFDILWKLSDERISVVAETFEEVQLEYQRMLQEGVSPQDINSAMMEYYQSKSKTM